MLSSRNMDQNLPIQALAPTCPQEVEAKAAFDAAELARHARLRAEFDQRWEAAVSIQRLWRGVIPPSAADGR